MEISLILTELATVDKVREYFEKATNVIHELKGRRGEFESKLQAIDDVAKDIPSLL